MRHLRTLSTLTLLAIGMFGCASPQPTAVGQRQPPTTALAADVPAEVAAEFKRSTAAWNNGDLETFLSVYSDDATLAQREGFLVGKTAIRMLYAERFGVGAQRDTLQIERLDVSTLCPDFALVRGVYRTTKNGTVTWRGAMTVVMRRIDGRWRIIHDHSY